MDKLPVHGRDIPAPVLRFNELLDPVPEVVIGEGEPLARHAGIVRQVAGLQLDQAVLRVPSVDPQAVLQEIAVQVVLQGLACGGVA